MTTQLTKKPSTALQNSIKELDKPLQEIIQKNYTRESPSFFDAQTVEQMQQATGYNLAELGLALLPLATGYAVAPVSNFNVGAVAFDSDHNAYLGANFQFANTHIGQTIHAEQSAISHAWQRGATDLALLVINYAPCGHCRQFINEVNLTKDFKIQLPNTVAKPLTHYLPESFGGTDLGITDKILGLDNQTRANQLKQETDAITLARKAHDYSHAPYSGNKNSIVLMYDDAKSDYELICGRYAENAAFNPTLPALQVALNYRRMQGKDWQNIKSAIMVETVTSLSQKQNAQHLLAEIADIELQYYASDVAKKILGSI